MKVFKVELMVIDFDRLGDVGVREAIENVRYPNRCMSPTVMQIDSRDIGEWEENNPLNYSSTQRAEYARLFSSAPPTAAAAAQVDDAGDAKRLIFLWDSVRGMDLYNAGFNDCFHSEIDRVRAAIDAAISHAQAQDGGNV